jgi:hypothetical protein
LALTNIKELSIQSLKIYKDGEDDCFISDRVIKKSDEIVESDEEAVNEERMAFVKKHFSCTFISQLLVSFD